MFEFKLPDLGEGVHEGQVVSVLVKEGDRIEEYQPMLEVETDKAAVEIPSPKAGTVAKVHVQPGQVVTVGTVMVTIDESGGGGGRAAAPAAQPAKAAASAQQAPAPKAAKAAAVEPARPEPARQPVAAEPVRSASVVEAAPSRGAGPIPAAPVVRKLAREMGVDLNAVTGTGPGGRIIREDVERYSLGHRGPAQRPASAARAPAAAEPQLDYPQISAGDGQLPDFSQYGPVRRVQAPQIRKTIARQMTRAWLNVPRVTHIDTVDITDLERNRKRFNESLRDDQSKLTMTAIVLKAVAAALREHPGFNSSYDPAAGEIIHKDYVHVGVAVDTPRGLVVPVVRDVDRKSLPQVSQELNDVAERVRNGKFDIAELRGATFTVTNVGALGGTFSTPMVNFPEVGILGLGRAKLQPAVHDGQIVPRLIMPLSLSFDHRVVDGADAARFTGDVISALENPLRLISM